MKIKSFEKLFALAHLPLRCSCIRIQKSSGNVSSMRCSVLKQRDRHRGLKVKISFIPLIQSNWNPLVLPPPLLSFLERKGRRRAAFRKALQSLKVKDFSSSEQSPGEPEDPHVFKVIVTPAGSRLSVLGDACDAAEGRVDGLESRFEEQGVELSVAGIALEVLGALVERRGGHRGKVGEDYSGGHVSDRKRRRWWWVGWWVLGTCNPPRFAFISKIDPKLAGLISTREKKARRRHHGRQR